MVQSFPNPGRKRRRSHEGIHVATEHAFLLPKSSGQEPLPFPPQPVIANPLANPIVQATDSVLPAPAPVSHHLFHSRNEASRPYDGTVPTPLPAVQPDGPTKRPHKQPHQSCMNLIQQNILLSPMDASSKKRSPFWQAFHQFNTKHPCNCEDRQHHAACNLCGRTVNMGRDNSTTTLSQHLRKCDRELWTRLKEETTPVVSSSKKISTKANEDGDGNNQLGLEALKQYVQVAFSVRFKDPPEEEWAGLAMILHKELNRKLTKETIRGIFQNFASSTEDTGKEGAKSETLPGLGRSASDGDSSGSSHNAASWT